MTERSTQAEAGVRRLMFVSDVHFGAAPIFSYERDGSVQASLELTHDPRAIEVMFAFMKAFHPHRLYLLGDILDLEPFSRYQKSHNHKTGFGVARKLACDFLDRARKVAGAGCQILWFDGNHEDRLEQYKIRQAEALEDVEEMTIPALLGLQEREIGYYPYDGERLLITPGFEIYHGAVVNRKAGYTAHQELMQGRSGLSGHTHRQALVCHTDRDGLTRWLEIGTLANMQPTYVKRRPADWQQGFAVGYLYPDAYLEPQLVSIEDGVIHHGGRVYSADSK